MRTKIEVDCEDLETIVKALLGFQKGKRYE